MTPDEVCKALEKIGAKVSRRTLLHYEEAELIPIPERGGGGREGRFSNYPERTVEEAFAAWQLIHGKYGEVENSLFEGKAPKISPTAVKKLRNLHINGIRSNADQTYEGTKEGYLARVKTLEKVMAQYDAPNEEEINTDLFNVALLSVSGMEKANFAFLDLWEAECARARLLLFIKKTVL